MDRTEINIEELKKKYQVDSLPFHLCYVAVDCKKRRDAFWRQYSKMKYRGNVVSIPLLIISSITGVTSVANISSSDSQALPIIVSIFGVSAAVLTAMQKYFRYSERAEHSKHLAKTYGRVARRIEHMIVMVESDAVKMEPEAFLKFVEDVQKDIDTLLAETDDNPKELLHDKKWYNKMFEKMKFTRDKITTLTKTNKTGIESTNNLEKTDIHSENISEGGDNNTSV